MCDINCENRENYKLWCEFSYTNIYFNLLNKLLTFTWSMGANVTLYILTDLCEFRLSTRLIDCGVHGTNHLNFDLKLSFF